MKIKSPLFLALLAVLLIALLYFLGPTSGPKNAGAPGNATLETPALNGIKIEPLATNAKKQIGAEYVVRITELENRLKSARSSEVPTILRSLIAVWDSAGSKIISAEYSRQLALQTKQLADYNDAGRRLVGAFTTAADSSIARTLSANAVNILQRAIELDSANIDNQVLLAQTYMEGQGEIMNGVQILLAITRKDSNNLKANYILGKFAVVSGQYEKAVKRLLIVTRGEPQNLQAALKLADAYQALGKKSEAAAALEHTINYQKDPKVREQLKAMVAALKN